MESEPPVSPYRVGPWTVRKLQDELKLRKLPITGKKDVLISRLEASDKPKSPKKEQQKAEVKAAENKADGHKDYSAMTITQLQKELKSRQLATVGRKDALIMRLVEDDSIREVPEPKAKTPVKKSPAKGKSPAKNVELTLEMPKSKVSFLEGKVAKKESLRNPFKVVQYALLYLFTRTVSTLKYLASHRLLTFILFLLAAAVTALKLIEGPHQANVSLVQGFLSWYGRWFILGVLSSIGLGTGAHTFVLFLGPFIAEVTTAAYACKSLDFAVEGVNQFLCASKGNTLVTVWDIAKKVRLETFLWGAGTAVDELPPYFIAKATAEAGKSSGVIAEVAEIESKPTKNLSDKTHLLMYKLIRYLGFAGILLAASIPNPLFDLVGITCGYFGVPFLTFWTATFIGKAVIKASIQQLFVILLFSEDSINLFINWVTKAYPDGGVKLVAWLQAQKMSFLGRAVSSDGTNPVAMMWNVVLAVMLGYFVLSIVHSLAVIYENELKEKESKKRQ